MCGIAGYINYNSPGNISDGTLIEKMLNTIVHRGPDDSGFWIGSPIAIGHRRLSILDLSESGHQPMLSSNGRFRIVFNGEIYNHLLLRRELEKQHGISWRGHSDTETLLECFSHWGVVETIRKSIGMFAFAVVDHHSNSLLLARDRMGEKPLYYGTYRANGYHQFVFASELSSVRALPGFHKKINIQALGPFLRHNYIPAPLSIYEDIGKLKPGFCLSVDVSSGEITETCYWSLNETIQNGLFHTFKGSFQDAVLELENLLGAAVKGQMISDVPLGAFLSGGIDSSSIVALMQSHSSQKVKTFSIGFDIDQFDESMFARQVADHLGTDHTECIISEKEALEMVPMISSFYAEPFADSSQLPTYLVAKIAKEKVTVSLSGDAGDELFGGYNRYLYASKLFNRFQRIPRPLRNLSASAIKSISPEQWNAILPFVSIRNIGEKLHKVAAVINSNDPMDLYKRVVSHTDRPSALLNEYAPSVAVSSYGWSLPVLHQLNDIEKMMAIDAMTYLPDDILVKVDRASMAVSLESRVPFLDHRVIEFAWSLPFEYKLHNGDGKRVLKELLYRHVPKKLMDRPKMGFGIPLTQWLRGPLRDWAHDLVNEKKMSEQALLNVPTALKIFNDHMSGKADNGYMVWNIIMLQAWLNEHV